MVELLNAFHEPFLKGLVGIRHRLDRVKLCHELMEWLLAALQYLVRTLLADQGEQVNLGNFVHDVWPVHSESLEVRGEGASKPFCDLVDVLGVARFLDRADVLREARLQSAVVADPADNCFASNAVQVNTRWQVLATDLVEILEFGN